MRHREFLNHLNNISQKKSLQETLRNLSEEGGSSTLAARPKIQYEPPPEPETKPVETTVSQEAGEIPRDPKTGKRLDMFDPNDAEHNAAAAAYTQRQLLKKKQAGEITGDQLANVRSQHQKKQEELISNQKFDDTAKAIEQGIDQGTDILGMAPGLGDAVDAFHAASYKARGWMSDDPKEKERYDQLAKDQVIYGLLLPAGIGAAAKGVAKGSKVGTEIASAAASKVPGIGKAASGAIDAVSGKVGKAATNLVTDLNPYGAIAGGYAGMQAAGPDADLGTKLMYGFGGAVLAGKAAKYGNQIPGLGKVIADPAGSLPYLAGKGAGKAVLAGKGAAEAAGKAVGGAVDATGKAIETGIDTAVSAIPEPIKRTARAGVIGTAVAMGTVPQAAGPISAPAIRAVDSSGISTKASEVAQPSEVGTAPRRDLVPTETKPKISQSPNTPKPKEEIQIKGDESVKQQDTGKVVKPAEAAPSRTTDRIRQEQKAQEEARAKEEQKAKQEDKPENKPKPETKPKAGIEDLSGPRLLGKQELSNTPLYGYSSTKFADALNPVFQREIRAQTERTTSQKKQLVPPLDRTDESTNLKNLITAKVNKILSEEELKGNMEPSISGPRSPQAARMQERSLSTMSTPDTRKNRANAIQRMKDAIAAMNVETPNTPKPTINPKYAGLPISAKSKKIPATKKILEKPS